VLPAANRAVGIRPGAASLEPTSAGSDASISGG